MTSLYNCKHSGDQYRVSKFDSDWNLEASYLCDLHSCECPAGHRPTCRHRLMLPKFIQRDAIGTSWFLDWDRGGWVQGWKEEPAAQLEPELTGDNFIDAVFGEPDFASAALPIQPEPEPSPQFRLGGFPDHCLSSGECTTPNDCILNGCAHGHGTPPREPSPSSPLPSPTIRRRV